MAPSSQNLLTCENSALCNSKKKKKKNQQVILYSKWKKITLEDMINSSSPRSYELRIILIVSMIGQLMSVYELELNYLPLSHLSSLLF